MSNRFSFGKTDFKYFIGYKDGKNVRPLCIMLSKISAYRRDFDETQYMSFLIRTNKLLDKYSEIWDKFSKVIKKGFDIDLIYNHKYLKTEIKFYEGKVSTNFHDDKVPEEDSHIYVYW